MEIIYRVLDKNNYHWINVRSNFIFVVSAVSCYALILRFHAPYIISFLGAVVAAVIVALVSPSLYDITKKKSIGIRIWALLTGIATVPVNAEYFFWRTTTSDSVTEFISRIVPGGLNTGRVLCYVVAFFAVYFWYVVMCFLCDWIKKIITRVLSECSKGELFIAGLVMFLLCVLVIWAFFTTTIFYQGCFVYGADSDVIISKNAYLVLSHMENDLRQPLFALFASPFIGVAFLISWFIPEIEDISVLAIMLIQIPVLVVNGLIFTNLASKNEKFRCILLTLFFSTYPALLFSVMTEQYVVTVFWLLVYVYLIVKKGERAQEAMIGAAGTLLTGAALVPFLWEMSEKNIKLLLKKIIETVVLGIFTLALFGRLELVLTLGKQMKDLGQFLGVRLSFGDKVLQYIEFARGCLIFPKSGVHIDEWIVWAVNDVTNVDFLGIAIIVLACAGFWVNKETIFARICIYWIVFSMFIIVIAGWGSEENCTILYALYFGWAFVGLIWELFYSVLKRIGMTRLLYPLGILVSCILLIVNIQAIGDLMNFAIQYYSK